MNRSGTISLISGGEGVHTVRKGICSKGNEIAWLEFEPSYYDDSDQHIKHYTMGTPLPVLEIWGLWNTSSLILTPGQLEFEIFVPVRVASMG